MILDRKSICRGAAACLALTAALVVTPRASAAPVRSDFFGVDAPDVRNAVAADQPTTLPAQAAAGMRVLREPFYWSDIETSPGTYDFSFYDKYVAVLAAAHMEELPVIFSTPAFRSACPSDAQPGACPPANLADLGGFVAILIGRYGPGGTFWSAHPSLPQLPIRMWQIWNEPNLPQYWHIKDPSTHNYTPDPSGYAHLLEASAPLIRAADPGAEIVSAGISDSYLSGAMRMVPFLQGMYAAGIKGSLDSLGLHVYCETPQCSLGLVQQARQVMDQAGDTATPIYITEMGWATGGGTYRFIVPDEATQASYIGQLLADLVAQRDQLHVRGVINYQWIDGPPGGSWASYTGLNRNDSSAKPALATWESFANDTTPPHTAIDGGPQATTTSADAAFSFSSDVAGSDYQCRLDSGGWADCTSPQTYSGLSLGAHTFTVRATDWKGNVDPTPPTAAWVVSAPAGQTGGSAAGGPAAGGSSTAPPPATIPPPPRRLLVTLVHARLDRLGRVLLTLRAPASGRLAASALVTRASVSRKARRPTVTMPYGSARVRCAAGTVAHLTIVPRAGTFHVLTAGRRAKLTVTVAFTASGPGGSGQSAPLPLRVVLNPPAPKRR